MSNRKKDWLGIAFDPPQARAFDAPDVLGGQPVAGFGHRRRSKLLNIWPARRSDAPERFDLDEASTLLNEAAAARSLAQMSRTEQLLTDIMVALPGLSVSGRYPDLSIVARQGDERPGDSEVMVDIREVAKGNHWPVLPPAGAAVFFRTDAEYLRVTYRAPTPDGGSVEATGSVNYHPSLRGNPVAFAVEGVALKLAEVQPGMGRALLRLMTVGPILVPDPRARYPMSRGLTTEPAPGELLLLAVINTLNWSDAMFPKGRQPGDDLAVGLDLLMETIAAAHQPEGLEPEMVRRVASHMALNGFAVVASGPRRGCVVGPPGEDEDEAPDAGLA